jgi:hypothetical protein
LSNLGSGDPTIRASLLLNLGQYQNAIDVIEGLEDQDLYSRFVLSKALFLNGENERAIIEVQKLKEQIQSIENETEREEFKKLTEVLARKIEIELTNQSRIGNINDAAYLSSSKSVAAPAKPQTQTAVSVAPAIDKKYDWYQNQQFVFISYKVTAPEVSQDAQVTFEEQAVNIVYKDQTVRIELTN